MRNTQWHTLTLSLSLSSLSLSLLSRQKKNPKGLFRKTTLDSYATDSPEWTTVLDIDALAKEDDISWVWKGSTALPRSRDPLSNNGQRTTLSLLSLSRGGSDAVHIKEFDLLKGTFVKEEGDDENQQTPFVLPEAKTKASYKSRNVLLVGTDMGEGSLTDSGYARTVREWVRGTPLKDAPIVFEGERTDVSVGMYISDQRFRGGGLYEVRYRSITFYTSAYSARPVQYEHLLAPHEREEQGIVIDDPPDFVDVDIQDDASFDIVGKMLLVTLRSDWQPNKDGPTYAKGSVVYTDAETLLIKGSEACEYSVLFAPTPRTALDYYTATKNFVVVVTMDNVKNKMDFYRIVDEGSGLERVGGDNEPKIRSNSVSPVDPLLSDEFWFTTSGYTQPSTLFLADASRVTEENDEEEDFYVVKQLKSLPPQFNADELEVQQRTATSKDGTEVPYFMIWKKGTELNGKNPTLVYGYGGFEVSLGPHYVPTAGIAWLERGGVYVEAIIRGGGEFGPWWHQVCCCCSGGCRSQTLGCLTILSFALFQRRL